MKLERLRMQKHLRVLSARGVRTAKICGEVTA
jgi:hypothetical protein